MLPQPRVRAGGFDGLLDDLTGRGFRLVSKGGLDTLQREAYLSSLQKLGGTLVELGQETAGGESIQMVEKDAILFDWMEKTGAVAVIARPDHYIYSSASTHKDAMSQLRHLASALA